jgi:hypothetical protein
MFGFGQSQDNSAAALLRQSMARLRARNQEQLALLLHHYQELQHNVTAAGGAVDPDGVEAEDLFDFWEEGELDVSNQPHERDSGEAEVEDDWETGQ